MLAQTRGLFQRNVLELIDLPFSLIDEIIQANQSVEKKGSAREKGIVAQQATAMIEQMREVIPAWPKLAREYGVFSQTMCLIMKEIKFKNIVTTQQNFLC